jgi:D-3-phosphoglycerate dehydrogenase / 2-oxoglutarate reductase
VPSTILVTEPIHADGLALLRARADVEVLEGWRLDAAAFAAAEAKAHGLLIRFHRCDAAFFARAKHLRIIARHGVGVDTVDLAAARDAGVTVAIAANANRDSVTEHTLWFLLSLAKPFDRWRAGMAALRTMDPAEHARLTPARFAFRDEGLGGELGGRTLLVIGLGRIGRRVAQIASVLGMRILVSDPYVDRKAGESTGYRFVDTLAAGLRQADYVTVHCPRNDETLGLIGAAELATLRPGSALVNCARGGIVDEAALAAALRSGHLSGAGVDVFDVEPPPLDNPLLGLPNAFLTPHAAAATHEAALRMATGAAENLLAFLDGCLDPSMVYPLPPN